MALSSRSCAARLTTLAAGAVKTVLVDARDERESERVTNYLKGLGFGIAAKFNGAERGAGLSRRVRPRYYEYRQGHGGLRDPRELAAAISDRGARG